MRNGHQHPHRSCKDDGHGHLVLRVPVRKVLVIWPKASQPPTCSLGMTGFSPELYFFPVILLISVSFTNNPLIFLEIVISYLIPPNKSLSV
jgi:hypothetical protein